VTVLRRSCFAALPQLGPGCGTTASCGVRQKCPGHAGGVVVRTTQVPRRVYPHFDDFPPSETGWPREDAAANLPAGSKLATRPRRSPWRRRSAPSWTPTISSTSRLSPTPAWCPRPIRKRMKKPAPTPSTQPTPARRPPRRLGPHPPEPGCALTAQTQNYPQAGGSPAGPPPSDISVVSPAIVVAWRRLRHRTGRWYGAGRDAGWLGGNYSSSQVPTPQLVHGLLGHACIATALSDSRPA
jgi:hypothetical protein